MCPAFETLEPRLLLDGSGPFITEFMAINDSTLADEDSDFSDWLEIHNPTAQPIDLTGWHLTDDDGDLTKWTFPATTLESDEYLIVFASDKDRTVPGEELHTNFKLSGDGEYLALVMPDGETVSHAYEPEYPQQLADISYGLPDATTAWETLVASGAEVGYHVPTPGEDVLAWTATEYDDSSWVHSITVDPAGIVLTEISTGDVRFVEIQNVSDQAISTTGWLVLANDATSEDVNDVNAVAWSLPTSIAAGEVLYNTDDAGDNYWGAPITWDAEGPGWAMIVDQGGEVRDFVGWGYTAGEIASLDIDYGTFTNITVGDDWSGAGADVGTTGGGGAVSEFVAFNDHVAGSGTHANATLYATNGTTSGLLKDIVTGDDTSVTLATTQSGVSYEGTQGAPAVGTDAYNIFDGYVDFTSGTGASLAIAGADHYTHTFTGLETTGGVTYDYTATAVRGGGYDERWTLVTLQGADSATPAHSTGIGVVEVSGTQVAIWTGENNGASQGFVASWTGIDPGADGEFVVVSTQYTGETPGVGSGTAGGSKAYGLTGLRLEQVAPAGPLSWLARTGDVDGDTADDFVRLAASSKGSQNPEMTVPFGQVLPTTTGVGFSDGDPAFDAEIHTDVGAEMAGVNASLWMRMPFNVIDMSMFDELTLRMKYDDGFAAYLNGVLIAQRNEPNPLAWDSAATDAHPNAQAVVFEDIDVTDYLLDALEDGPNVLAIHGLNVGAADDDFLILPELIATSNLDEPQYMTTPTAGFENVPGALGLVADTQFSVDRGFYDAPFDLEITTATVGAEIRYTLDCSRPTATTGEVYDGPITISGQTVVRAAAFRPGYLSTNVDSQTYLFVDDVAVQTRPDGYPTSWGGEPSADYDMDQSVTLGGQYHDRFIEGLTEIPTLSVSLPMEDIFGSGGLYSNTTNSSLEREASAELIFPDGSDGFQIDAGLKIQGGASRNPSKAIKHSLSLRFRGIYGAGKLDFPLFEGSPVDSFNSIQLRAMYNNSWIHWDQGQRDRGEMIRDQWARDVMLAMGQIDAAQGTYVHLYINGLHWGVYNLHERPEASHYAAYNGGDEDTLDASNGGSFIDGNSAAWNAMKATVAGGDWEDIQQVVDIDNYIDWTIVQRFGGNRDLKSDGNWRAAGGGPDSMPWHFYLWDTERILEDPNNTNPPGGTADPPGIWNNLYSILEFRVRFADRLHKHLFNDGALTATATEATWTDRATELDLAIIAESARWGDDRPGGPYYRDDQWVTERDRLLGSYFPVRTANMVSRYRSDGLYPDVDAPVFSIDGAYQHGGEFSAGDPLTMAATAGTIYYTLDGTDPRAPGGGVSGTAIVYSGAITLDESTPVKARAYDGGEWSALNDAVYHTVVPPTLAITEVNYNPYSPSAEEIAAGYAGSGEFEFVEIRNVGPAPVSLRTVHFGEGVEFHFLDTGPASLAAGDYILVVSNVDAFEYRYGAGLPVAGAYTGRLNDGGELVALAHGAATNFIEFEYDDGGAWPGRADGKGSSLEVLDTGGDYADDDNWRSSIDFNGSPGAAGTADYVGIVINEVLTHTDEPQFDAIELYNPTGGEIDLDGWYLSDSSGQYKKFRIPNGTSLEAGEYVVFDESDFNASGGVDPDDFALDGAHGEEVWLMVADAGGELTRFADHVEFGGAANGESFGRWPNGATTGGVYPMLALTLDGPNAGPRVGPLVISEVQYNPGDFLDPNDREFVEIYNPTDDAVDLTDWRIRKGVDYDFLPGTTIEAWSVLVVLSFNPTNPDNAAKLADFRSYYGIDPSVPLVGGYSGSLSNGGEKVQLQRPDEPPIEEPLYTPHILEDEIDYDDEAPWPIAADGTGDSLHRVAPGLWGHDPASWLALPPTPGADPWAPVVTVDPLETEDPSPPLSGTVDDPTATVTVTVDGDPYPATNHGDGTWTLADDTIDPLAPDTYDVAVVAIDPSGNPGYDPTTDELMITAPPEVIGRYVFYNRSAWDGNDPAANANDDGAIAPSPAEASDPWLGKTALLPGGTATFQNYTSYSRGINGIMIDVANLAELTLTAADFEFHVGNDSDPSGWDAAPAPVEIAVRENAGEGSSDRITIIWADNAIEKQWLQVTVKSTASTGLACPDVFYWGNAIGETGNDPANAYVNSADRLATRANPHNFFDPAAIDDAYDFDRDKNVNSSDRLKARANTTTFFTALKLITAPTAPPAAPETPLPPTSQPLVFGARASTSPESALLPSSPLASYPLPYLPLAASQRPSAPNQIDALAAAWTHTAATPAASEADGATEPLTDILSLPELAALPAS